jgi:hypothetical protein
MKTNIQNIINETLMDEVKRTILEGEKGNDVFHITCEGEPIDSFESEEEANQHLNIYKDKHPEKEFIIEKQKYNSHSDMIDKLDEMGEKFEVKETKTMEKKSIKVKNIAQAILDAKERGLSEIKVGGETYNVEESYKQLEEEEMCSECGDGPMEEDYEMGESNAFIVAADAARDAGKKEFEFPKGSGEMHKVTIKQDIDIEEGEGMCNECGSPMNEEGQCSECSTMKEEDETVVTNMDDLGEGDDEEVVTSLDQLSESKRATLRLSESELVSLISRIVSESKEDDEKMEVFYVMNDKDQVKNISKTESDAKKFLEKSLKGEGKIKSKIVNKKDYDNEKVTVSTIKNYTLNESVPGLEFTKKAQKTSGDDSKSHMSDVEKKLKDISTFDGNDNPEFPNQINKGEKVAQRTTDEENETIEDNRGGTLADLDYDYEPSERFKIRLKKALEGDSTMGNSQDAANVITSKTGENISKKVERKAKKLAGEKQVSWGHKGIEPLDVKTVNESKTTMSSILEEEVQRMKKIFGYNEKTQ